MMVLLEFLKTFGEFTRTFPIHDHLITLNQLSN
jgi:hypothetical protein